MLCKRSLIRVRQVVELATNPDLCAVLSSARWLVEIAVFHPEKPLIALPPPREAKPIKETILPVLFPTNQRPKPSLKKKKSPPPSPPKNNK